MLLINFDEVGHHNSISSLSSIMTDHPFLNVIIVNSINKTKNINIGQYHHNFILAGEFNVTVTGKLMEGFCALITLKVRLINLLPIVKFLYSLRISKNHKVLQI